MYTFDNMFGSKSRTLRQQNFFSSTSLAHILWTFVQWHPINAQHLQT